MHKPHVGELVFFFILFGIVALLGFAIMSPYVVPLFVGGVFAIVFAPLQKFFERQVKGYPTLAALCTVLVVLVLILIPLIILFFLLFQEVSELYLRLSGGEGTEMINAFSVKVQNLGSALIPGFKFNVNLVDAVQNVLRWVGLNLSSFFSGVLTFVFDVFLVIIAMFFLFRDGARLRAFAVKWSPLPDRYDESILAKLEIAITSVVKGSLTSASVQGILVGFGFTIFGVPNPILWGSVAAVAALVPLIGTSIITMPAAVMLILTGHLGAGIGLVVYALLVVGLSDNVLNPILVRRGVDIHPFMILLSVFGGLAYFGPVGFLAGPIVIAFFFTLLDIYPEIVRGRSIPDTPQAD